MNGHNQLRKDCLRFLVVIGILIALPYLFVWRARREERLSARLLTVVKNVMFRSDTAYFAEKAEQEKALQQTRQDEATVARLLREGADPNVRDVPLVKRSLWQEAKFLLKQMLFHPSASNPARSALSMAVQAQNADIVLYLLRKGATDVNGQVVSRYGDNTTPLVNYAASVGNLYIVRALCAYGADIHQLSQDSDRENVSILQAALDCNIGYTDTMTLDMEDLTPPKRQARTEVFHLLLTRGAKYELKSQTEYALLCTAAEGDFLDVARELLVAGVSPNAKAEWSDGHLKYTPLNHAVAVDDTALVKILLQHGAHLREDNAEAPILLARSPTMAKLLLEAGADIHACSKSHKHKGENILTFAAMRSDTKLIAFLLAHGFHANDGGEEGSPILEAASYADLQTVRLLLEHGAKVGPSSPGASALWLAIAQSNIDSAFLILQYGASVNSLGDETPLTEAANQDFADIASELIVRGADVNAGNGAALLGACASCDEDLVELLLQHGAHPNVQTSDGTTAIQLVRANEDPPGDADDVIALLKKYGAKR